jgi:ABC-type antimicrobial peptide transport system permease subunit
MRECVVAMVVLHGLWLVGAGVAAGLLVAALLAPRLQSLLFHVSAFDPLVFGSVATLLAVVGVVATASPAWRAARVDPASVLRSD